MVFGIYRNPFLVILTSMTRKFFIQILKCNIIVHQNKIVLDVQALHMQDPVFSKVQIRAGGLQQSCKVILNNFQRAGTPSED